MQQVEEALLQIEKIVLSSGIENDIIYFNYHKKRFHKMGETVSRMVPPGSSVLDIGSHYLHSSLLLQLLGYKVVSMDVSEFWELDYIRQRAADHQLTPVIENQLEHLGSLSEEKEQYDLILFTEIFEHITFNPIAFWKRIHTLIKNKGKIYITTPNAITLYAIVKTLFNLITFRGIGMDVKAIFPTVTYGHHWKEYSTSEIKSYFNMLNDGFHLDIQKFQYKPTETAHHWKSSLRILLTKMSNAIPFFREAMEVVVTVDKSYPWKINPPKY
jgi:2-polyprenyl-3-methyl-5-hydroxy-6-metoxy-1,4-benzoquinol methylase